MKDSTENDKNFRYEKITIVVDNIPLISLAIRRPRIALQNGKVDFEKI
jgi:hypothetical protein